MLIHTQFAMLVVSINLYVTTPFPLTGNNFRMQIWSSCTHNICGRYLIIVLVRYIIHIFSYSYSFLKVTPVLLVSNRYD